MGVIFGLIATFLASAGVGLAVGFLGALGIFSGIIVLVIIFIIGVFIEDLIEGATRKM